MATETMTTDSEILTPANATTTMTLSSNKAGSAENQLRPLYCVAQQYAWGRLGSSSTVARMKDEQTEAQEAGESEFTIHESKPYAELWLGTHPNGMSQVAVPDEETKTTVTDGEEPPLKLVNLVDYVQSNPVLHCGDAKATDITFLLKVLSVRKVLSIQAHPDKALAQKLHAERPHIYKDPNHKPEMAIAMSDQVRAMCGFRPLSEIATHLFEYPEFAQLLGTETSAEIARLQNSTDKAEIKTVLQNMFEHYMQQEDAVIQRHVNEMVQRLQQQALQQPLNDVQKLILQLEEQFPGDSGIFAPLIFNVVRMTKGEGLFIGANEPHAYVSGEILECMACSDNVVRAGLTPKLKDVPTLVSMLTYNCSSPDITSGEKVDACTVRYQPPVDDFCVEIVTVPAGQTYELQAVASPGVLLTMEGDGVLKQNAYECDVSFGLAAFCSANTSAQLMAGPYGVQVARAFSNVYHQK